MAVANLHEMIIAYKLRKSALTAENAQLQEQKQISTAARSDQYQLYYAQKSALKDQYTQAFEDDPYLQEAYKDLEEYLDSEAFEDDLDKITADYNMQIDELTNWESQLDAQITTNSTEMEEIDAYLESWNQMLSSNLQEDYNFGLSK